MKKLRQELCILATAMFVVGTALWAMDVKRELPKEVQEASTWVRVAPTSSSATREGVELAKARTPKAEDESASTKREAGVTEVAAAKKTTEEGTLSRHKSGISDFVAKVWKPFARKNEGVTEKDTPKRTKSGVLPAPESVVEDVKDFTQKSEARIKSIQEDWTRTCDTFEKMLKGVVGVDTQEARKVLDVLKEGFDGQTKDQLSSSIQLLKNQIDSFSQKTPDLIEGSKKDLEEFIKKSTEMMAELDKLVAQKVQIVDEETIPERKVKPFRPSEQRKAKITQGASCVAVLAQSPERITEMLPRPIFLDDFLAGNKVLSAEERKEAEEYVGKYLNLVESVGEYFLSNAKKAVAKDRGPDFVSGTTVIEDKNGQLYKFLQGYVETVFKLKNGPTAALDKPCFVANGTAYPRISSHFDAKINYGIDLMNPIHTVSDPNPDSREVRSHFLFGKTNDDLGNPLMYVKFETHGLGTPKDAAMHVLNYVRRKSGLIAEQMAAKVSGSKKSKKAKVKQGEEKESGKAVIRDRRENTPAALMKEYKAALKESGVSKAEQKKLLDAAKTRGIAAIHEQVSQLSKHADKYPAAAKLKTRIENTYVDGNLDIRKGNEIIVRAADLQRLAISEE